MNDFRNYQGVDFSQEFLAHYGVGHDKGGNSGRYKWGSGDRPYQRTSMEGKSGNGDKEEPRWIGSHRLGGTHLTRAERQRLKAQRDARSDSQMLWQDKAPGILQSTGYALRHPDQIKSAVTNFISERGGIKVSKEYADAYKEAFEKEIHDMSSGLNEQAMKRMTDAQSNLKLNAVDKAELKKLKKEQNKALQDYWEVEEGLMYSGELTKDGAKKLEKELAEKKKIADAAIIAYEKAKNPDKKVNLNDWYHDPGFDDENYDEHHAQLMDRIPNSRSKEEKAKRDLELGLDRLLDIEENMRKAKSKEEKRKLEKEYYDYMGNDLDAIYDAYYDSLPEDKRPTSMSDFAIDIDELINARRSVRRATRGYSRR